MFYLVKFDSNHRPVALAKSRDIVTVWYRLIQEFKGNTFDTSKTLVDSIATLKSHMEKSPTKIVPFCEKQRWGNNDRTLSIMSSERWTPLNSSKGELI